MKVMAGVSSGFPDRHATKATALRKTMALRIPKTGHVAEATSMRLAAAISGCFTCIRKKCHSRWKSRLCFSVFED